MRVTTTPLKAFASNERGASAIVLGLVLVVLLGFAAIAVDIAAAWALKRQDQAAADTGALAGALFTANRSQADAMQHAEDEIIRITYSTVTPDMTAAEWAAEWAACSDPAKPVEFVETLGSDCISFTATLEKLRVTLPTVPWKTTFARVLGFEEINTTASAEVSISLGTGGVLPFGMPGSAESDVEVCLKTGANPQHVAPCDGPDEGNFGFLHFTHFGNTEMGTTTNCNVNDLEENVARGIDHPLGVWSGALPAPSHVDRDACNDGSFNSRPYQVDTEPGNVAQALDDGFADGTGGLPGRLARGSNLTNVRGHMLDNTALWDHLNAAGLTLCGAITSHDQLVTCLGGYTAADGVIFEADVVEAPRFGWVPLFHEMTLGGGQTTFTIKDFKPIYIQTTLWGCNALGCDLEWDPSEGVTPGPNNKVIEASTAISFPAGSLPTDVYVTGPGADGQVNYLLSR